MIDMRMSGTNDKKVYDEYDDDDDEYDDEEEEDKKCPPNRHVSRWNLNEGHKRGGATLVEREDAQCPLQQVPWSKENEERGKHHKHKDKHAHKHHKQEHTKWPSTESSDHQKAYREFAQKDEETINMEEGAFCAEWKKINEAPNGHVPGSDPNERGVSNEARKAARKHHKRRDKHSKHGHKHHKQEHTKQPSMESPNHQKAHLEFAQKDEESIKMGEGVLCAEWEKINEATDGHDPGFDLNERGVSNEARQAAHGSSGGRHALSSSRGPGPDVSPGAEGVDGRAHSSNNAQRRTHAFPPTRPGAVRVPGPDNEGLGEDEEQMTVVSHEESIIPILAEAERVNTEDEERRRQVAINQAMDDFIATAPVADVVPEVSPDNKGRRRKLVGAFLLVIMIATAIGFGLGRGTGEAETMSQSEYEALLSNVSSDGGEALRNSSTPQYEAFNWTVTTNTASTDEQIIQRYALATLFYSTNGSSWKNTNGWLSEQDECLWHGLKCTTGTTSGAVSELNLFGDDYSEGNNLIGTLPPEIGLLSKLELVWLALNKLVGTIPSEVGLLTKLTILILSNNKLSGAIPSEIGVLSESLEYLALDLNGLEGTIPSEVGQLMKLIALVLSNNTLSGVIPSEIGMLSDSLEGLGLDSNELEGTIPSEVGQLTTLAVLSLAANELSGVIPSEINLLVNLSGLYLYGNKFTGNYTCPKSIEECWISCDFYLDEYTDACRSL